MPLEKSLGRRKHYFWPLLNSAMVFVVACYLSFAILGYLFFGEDTQAPISNNLSEGHLGDSVKLTLSLSLYFTYAIQMFPVSDLCDEAIASRMGILAGSSAVEEKSRLLTAAAEQEVSAVGGVSGGPSVSDPLSSGGGGASDAEGGGSGALHHGGHVGADILSASATPAARSRFLLFTSLARVGLVLVTAVISGIFANFGVIVSLVGAVSVSALAYIMPMLVHLKLCIPPGGHTWRTSAPQIVIIVVGVLASISNLYFAIRDI
jgi:proton-coupled amino acid transporter